MEITYVQFSFKQKNGNVPHLFFNIYRYYTIFGMISHMLRSYFGKITMSKTASQITNLTIVCSNVYLASDQSQHQSSAPLAFVRGIHRWPVKSPHKGPVTR